MNIITVLVSSLAAHPKNPRIEPRQDVVDQIASQIQAKGKFDESHSLIVREIDNHYQIISGHHRWLAAQQAGISELPCWVKDNAEFNPFREMQDLVFLANECGVGDSFTLTNKQSSDTVSVAIKDDLFTGEYITPPSIQHLNKWVPKNHLSTCLEMWNIPVCPDTVNWKIEVGANFYRAADLGLFDNPKNNILLKRVIPDNIITSPDFSQYVGKNFVYFIQAAQLGLIKIGFSSNVPKRLLSLKTGCPDDLVILKIIPGGQEIERILHKKFADIRVKGEWFSPTKELMAFITEAAQ